MDVTARTHSGTCNPSRSTAHSTWERSPFRYLQRRLPGLSGRCRNRRRPNHQRKRGMKSYIEELQGACERAHHERLEAIRATERKRINDCRIHCETPLTEQIEALMRSLPLTQRDRPWSMDELVARLQGRYHARPSAGDVGIALRKIGWTRIRDWSRGGGGRRVWSR